MFSLNNAGSPYPHVTPRDLAELQCAALRRGASVQRPQPDNFQEARPCGSGTQGWRPGSEPLSAGSNLLSLLPDRHGQNPCPALGYLTCSGMFTKVPSETQNTGMQVCHRVLLQESWLTQQWVCLPTDARSGRWSGGTVRSRMESEDGCTPRLSCCRDVLPGATHTAGPTSLQGAVGTTHSSVPA